MTFTKNTTLTVAEMENLRNFISEIVANQTATLQNEITNLRQEVRNLTDSNKELVNLHTNNVKVDKRPEKDQNHLQVDTSIDSVYEGTIIEIDKTDQKTDDSEFKSAPKKHCIKKNKQSIEPSDSKKFVNKQTNINDSKVRNKPIENVILGSQDDDSVELRATFPKLWFYVGMCNGKTTADDVRFYLTKKSPNCTFEVGKLNSKGVNAPFKVSATDVILAKGYYG